MKNYLLFLLQMLFVIAFFYGVYYKVMPFIAFFSAAFVASVLIDFYIFLRNTNQL
jgi:hypothetical protein